MTPGASSPTRSVFRCRYAPTSTRRWPSFPARFGIIELKGDGMMPVTLRNLEALVETRMIKTGKQDDPRRSSRPRRPGDQLAEEKNRRFEAATRTAVPGSFSRVADGDVMAMLGG